MHMISNKCYARGNARIFFACFVAAKRGNTRMLYETLRRAPAPWEKVESFSQPFPTRTRTGARLVQLRKKITRSNRHCAGCRDRQVAGGDRVQARWHHRHREQEFPR